MEEYAKAKKDLEILIRQFKQKIVKLNKEAAKATAENAN